MKERFVSSNTACTGETLVEEPDSRQATARTGIDVAQVLCDRILVRYNLAAVDVLV
eukprot:CAMPEP_0182577676 /NCGR_PEP_ID=MMETSP1324-20130603/38540_1 /TAXON_ID=236786 /ORGANISM="Florenciella sp., Strain RCC1587" /LENGTH=55 /DNA_ID=CAMNT_0024793531 /DNA_START=520 /DNA_END=683 /DNA_ORIENTATION=+